MKIVEDRLAEIMQTININSSTIEKIIDEVTSPMTAELDNYVLFIKDILNDGNNPPTAQELDDFCMNLSTYLYFAGAQQERLGIKDDISTALYKETFNNFRQSQTTGTVADRNAAAELSAMHEELVSIIYQRSYKIVKAKVMAGQELLSSVKKIISRRMNEQDQAYLMGGR